jgi:A/G-specific adenine glycosylase
MTPPTPPARLAALRRRLLRWYRGARRDLPWRFPEGKGDPYRTWISEVMLQQTRVQTAIPYYRRFVRTFPTLEALAAASEGQVLAAWTGLGYYSRARSLRRAAREAIARFGGLPGTVEGLRELPGLGPYTAGAVASIAFGLSMPAVDGNAGRVLARLFRVEAEPQAARFRELVWSRAGELVRNAPDPGALNQALIELGALVCRPRSPLCARCPLERLCSSRRAGVEGVIPRVRRRPRARAVTLAVAVCTWRGRVLLRRRPAQGLFAGMWAPPFFEVAVGEDPRVAISNAIHREPSVSTGEFTFCGAVQRALTHRALTLEVFTAPLLRRPRRDEELLLVDPAELSSVAVPSAARAALSAALDGSRRTAPSRSPRQRSAPRSSEHR